MILDKWTSKKGINEPKCSVTESSESDSNNVCGKIANDLNTSQKSASILLDCIVKEDLCNKKAKRALEHSGYRSQDESQAALQKSIVQDDSLLPKSKGQTSSKNQDGQSSHKASQKTSDKATANDVKQHKKKNQKKMQILEKIIQIESENDTCSDIIDDDIIESNNIAVKKPTKKKKEKKKQSEIDWLKSRQTNHIYCRRWEIIKYDQDLKQHFLNESAETGTSNILDAIRDELTTDND